MSTLPSASGRNAEGSVFLRFWGSGSWLDQKCTANTTHGRGVPRPSAPLRLSAMPWAVSNVEYASARNGRSSTPRLFSVMPMQPASIVFRGTARTGAAGALIPFPTSCRCTGSLSRGPAELEGVEVEVTRTVHIQEAQVESGARMHRLADDVRVLEAATWSPL